MRPRQPRPGVACVLPGENVLAWDRPFGSLEKLSDEVFDWLNEHVGPANWSFSNCIYEDMDLPTRRVHAVIQTMTTAQAVLVKLRWG